MDLRKQVGVRLSRSPRTQTLYKIPRHSLGIFMSAVTIINVYDGINATTYTFGQYYTDTKRGPSTTTAYENAVAAINSMGSFWAQQHNGTYIGHDPEEGGFVVKDSQGEVALIYYVQVLQAATEENLADRIV